MSQEYAKSYDQLLDSEVRLGAGDCSVGSNGHGSHETIDTDTGNQESSIGPSSATAKHLTNQSTFRWLSSIVYVDNRIGNFGNYLQ